MSDEDCCDTSCDTSCDAISDSSVDISPDYSVDSCLESSSDTFDLSSDDSSLLDESYVADDAMIDESLTEGSNESFDESPLEEEISDEPIEEMLTEDSSSEDVPKEEELLTEDVPDEQTSKALIETERAAELEDVSEEERMDEVVADAEKQEVATTETGGEAVEMANDASAAARAAESAAARLQDVDSSDSSAVESAVREAQEKGAEAENLSAAASAASDAADAASEQAREISDQVADVAAEQAKEAENASDAAEQAAREAEEEARRLQEEAETEKNEAERAAQEAEEDSRRQQEEAELAEAEAVIEQEDQVESEAEKVEEEANEAPLIEAEEFSGEGQTVETEMEDAVNDALKEESSLDELIEEGAQPENEPLLDVHSQEMPQTDEVETADFVQQNQDQEVEEPANGKFESLIEPSEEVTDEVYREAHVANEMYDDLRKNGSSYEESMDTISSGKGWEKVTLEEGESLARVEDSEHRFNEASHFYTTDDALKEQGVLDESGVVNGEAAKEKYALPEYARDNDGAVLGERSADTVSHREVEESITAYMSEVAPARDSNGVDSVEREGGARQIVVPDTSKLSDYKEQSVQNDANEGGLKDLLARSSEAGVDVEAGDIPPSDDEGMDDRNRLDQRDAVAYNTLLAKQASER